MFIISRSISVLTALTCVLSLMTVNASADAKADQISQGQRIYQQGIVGSGAPLEALQAGSVALQGQSAACVNCHRPSGMGSVEGDIPVPPIAGNFLFDPDQRQVTNMDPRSGKRFSQTHPPYTDETLLAAITKGLGNTGRNLNPVMPQFKLSNEDAAALIAYLRQLSTNWSPGVDAQTIELATIITPEVDPVRRKAFLNTLQLSVTQKNGSTLTHESQRGRHHMISAAELVLGTERKWNLHVWELQGAPETWKAQLEEKLQAQPVFAVLSGLSDATWAPVHDFCEQQRLPCWLPVVSVPVTSQSFYSLYFNKGVLLEADVLSSYLTGDKKPKRVVQIRRNDAAASAAANQLASQLGKAGIESVERVVNDGDSLAAPMTGLGADDVVMNWLHGADLAGLEKTAPPVVKAAYFSAELLEGKQLPKSWQNNVRLIYPYELPEKRQSNLTNFRAWHAMKKLPIVDEAMQADAFFAVEFLTETLGEMLDNLHRDYLLERAEGMMSRSEAVKSEQQVRERQMRGQRGALTQQTSTSIYPRLSLGIGQRFASKGAYIVRYAEDGSLRAESDWIVP